MLEYLATDLVSWEIGPYHGALPGPMLLKMKLDGEVIVSAEFETGFLHRGLEKTMELHVWQSIMPYADRLDPEGPVFGEIALSLAVEEICGIQVTPRAQNIRVILAELTRISSHMAYIVKMAKAVQADTIVHYVLRDREKILDLFELLTGSRFSINFLRFGGVCADVTDGFIERILEVCDLIRIRLKEYNDVFSFNEAFLHRTKHVGVITQELAYAVGLSGPNVRAAGISMDFRKSHPHGAYQDIDFDVPLGRGEFGTQGDAHDRFLLRLREIAQSLEILKQVAENVSPGEFQSIKIDKDFVVPSGEAFTRVESPRGLLACHVVSDGGSNPCRVQFRTPSTNNLMAVPVLVAGARIEDLPIILASLDISVAEVDR